MFLRALRQRHCLRYDLAMFPTLLVMATILRLPYTMAIAPYSRGGLLYGLPYDCQVSAGPCVLQHAESAPHSPLPRPAGDPALCSSDPRRGGDHAHRATPPADGGAPQGAHQGPHA